MVRLRSLGHSPAFLSNEERIGLMPFPGLSRGAAFACRLTAPVRLAPSKGLGASDRLQAVAPDSTKSSERLTMSVRQKLPARVTVSQEKGGW